MTSKRPKEQHALRWGILGAAEIARKNWKAIQLTANSTVTGVASRDLDRSRGFIAQCQAEAPMPMAPKAFGSYEELLKSKEVDAVYIPLPTGLRKEWVMRAAAAGKHVVCEKPCAGSVTDLEEMLAACRRHRVQFMDGVMFVHSRRFERLRQELSDQQSIGRIRRIDSAFSFFGGPEFFQSNIRAQSELEPLGCLGDLGWYCIRLSLWVMNWQMPLQITGRLLSKGKGVGSPGNVPMEFSGELIFDGGVSAGFYCSFVTTIQQWAIISGTTGSVQMADFVLPFVGKDLVIERRRSDYRINGCYFRMETEHRTIAVPEWSHGHELAQETNCFRNFADQTRSGKLNEVWSAAALKTEKVMCGCLESAKTGETVALR